MLSEIINTAKNSFELLVAASVCFYIYMLTQTTQSTKHTTCLGPLHHMEKKISQLCIYLEHLPKSLPTSDPLGSYARLKVGF